MLSNPLEVNFWDVGQGDCSTISLPNGSIVVIDTGPRGSPLIDWLHDKPKKIHAVVLTHNDADHTGSLASLVRSFMDQIGSVFLLVDRPANDPSFNKLFRLVLEGEKRGFYGIRRLEAGIVIWSDSSLHAELVTLFPTMADNVLATNPNETSGILCLRINGKTQVVWPGDSTLKTVASVCSGSKPYVLVGPHHGAPSDYKPAAAVTAINAIAPLRSFISVGTRNSYTHPKAKYVQRLERSGSRVLCSQITNSCDRNTVHRGIPVMGSHLALGLRPPRNGVSCRGAWQIIWNGTSFESDAFEAEHLLRISNFRRPQCLHGRTHFLLRRTNSTS